MNLNPSLTSLPDKKALVAHNWLLKEQQRLAEEVGEPLFVTIRLVFDGFIEVELKTFAGQPAIILYRKDDSHFPAMPGLNLRPICKRLPDTLAEMTRYLSTYGGSRRSMTGCGTAQGSFRLLMPGMGSALDIQAKGDTLESCDGSFVPPIGGQ